jgi:hypothetical protein
MPPDVSPWRLRAIPQPKTTGSSEGHHFRHKGNRDEAPFAEPGLSFTSPGQDDALYRSQTSKINGNRASGNSPISAAAAATRLPTRARSLPR